MNWNEILDAIAEYVRRAVKNTPSEYFQATFVSSEALDADLSHIQLPDGTSLRGVRKYEHVTGLTAGMVVDVRGNRSDSNLIIVGHPVGDITKYIL